MVEEALYKEKIKGWLGRELNMNSLGLHVLVIIIFESNLRIYGGREKGYLKRSCYKPCVLPLVLKLFCCFFAWFTCNTVLGGSHLCNCLASYLIHTDDGDNGYESKKIHLNCFSEASTKPICMVILLHCPVFSL